MIPPSPSAPPPQQYQYSSVRQQVVETYVTPPPPPIPPPAALAAPVRPGDVQKDPPINPYDNDSDNFDSDNDDPPPVQPKTRSSAPNMTASTHAIATTTTATTTATSMTHVQEHQNVSHASGPRTDPSELKIPSVNGPTPNATMRVPITTFDDSKTVATHALPRSVNIIRDQHGSVRVVGEFGTHHSNFPFPSGSISNTGFSSSSSSSAAVVVEKNTVLTTQEKQAEKREERLNQMIAELSVSTAPPATQKPNGNTEPFKHTKAHVLLAAYRPSHPDSAFLESLLHDNRTSYEKTSDDKKKNGSGTYVKKQSERTKVTLADAFSYRDVQKRIKTVSPFMTSLLRQYTTKKDTMLLPPSVTYSLSKTPVYDYAFQWCGPDNVIVNPGSLAIDVGRVNLPRSSINPSVAVSGMHTLAITWTLADAVQTLPLTLQYWEVPAESKNNATAMTSVATENTDNVPVIGMRVLKAALYDSNHKMLYVGAVKEYPLMQLQKQNVDKSVLCCDVSIYENIFFLRLSFMPSVDLNSKFGFTVEYMPILKKETPSNLLKHIKIHCSMLHHS